MIYRERLQYLRLPTSVYRRVHGDMIEVFKIIHNLYDQSVVPSLIRNFDTRTRGNSFKLQVDRCKYDLRKYSFCNRVTSVWNSLWNTLSVVLQRFNSVLLFQSFVETDDTDL